MVPVISFVGKSNSGKTTLVEKLIPVLKAKGYRVGVIKHTSHTIRLDTPGKDTFRFQAAGSDATALVTKEGMTLFKPDENPDPELIAAEHFNSMDIAIVEGFKKSGIAKIEVLGAAGDLLNPEISDRIAVAADFPVDSAGLPQFGRDDISAIADFIEKKLLLETSRSETMLWVDGEFIDIKPFVKAFIGQTVKGMVSTLRGAKKPEKVRLKIGR